MKTIVTCEAYLLVPNTLISCEEVEVTERLLFSTGCGLIPRHCRHLSLGMRVTPVSETGCQWYNTECPNTFCVEVNVAMSLTVVVP